MSDTDEKTIGWRQLREFSGVDLGRSYVLSWQAQGDMILIDIDLYLEPEHPFYEKPRPAEKACIRPAAIEFPHYESVRLTCQGSSQIIENISEIGIGAISGLSVPAEGHYAISGEFGTVSLVAERPILRLKGP